MADTMGETMLVASRRPPSPTSSTASDDTRLSKQIEGNGRRALEERRKAGQCPVGDQPFGDLLHPRSRALQLGVVHLVTVNDEALGQPDQVRGGVARHAVARRAQRGLGHRRDRSLAVGARRSARRRMRLGMVERLQQPGHVGQAELHPEAFEAEEELERGGAHGRDGTGSTATALPTPVAAVTGAATENSRNRAIVSLSSRRSTIMSSMP